MNKIDECPLLSSLIGVSVPMNSLGKLHLEYLDMPEKDKTFALLNNWQ